MRVVAGTARGRRLASPPGDRTRPTTDRVREAIFNALWSRAALDDARVLDLFAGSGALGIEALSRGAAHATFVDDDPRARRTIAANLATCGFQDRAEVVADRAERYLARLAAQPTAGPTARSRPQPASAVRPAAGSGPEAGGSAARAAAGPRIGPSAEPSGGAATTAGAPVEPGGGAAITAGGPVEAGGGAAIAAGGPVEAGGGAAITAGAPVESAGGAATTAGAPVEAGGGAGPKGDGARRFDVAFCDPPYAFDGWAGLLADLPADLVVIEAADEVAVPDGWDLVRSSRYGTTWVGFAEAR